MRNGYFRLVHDNVGFGVALYQPEDGGEEILGQVMAAVIQHSQEP